MSNVATTYDASNPEQLQATDTVYGVAADAFEPRAVARLLAAKGRGREMPPPVLISDAGTIDALALEVPTWARALVENYWPGALTVVCHQQPSLTWDLGETRGTVAIRMPDLLSRSGPLAVSSANLTGRPAATTAGEAADMLGEEVAVILDAGAATGGVASTILDCTGASPYLLREGAIAAIELRQFLAGLEGDVGLEEG